MPSLKSKHQMATDAEVLAQSFQYVRHGQVTYAPQDFETGDTGVIPDPERTIWIPLTQEDLQQKAYTQFQTLFESTQALTSWEFMIAQSSTMNRDRVDSLLIRTKDGLRELKGDGKLHEPSGKFIPNTLKPMLNEDPDDKAEVMRVLTSWVDSEEEAISMLRHFATALAPHWSAVKYVLLLGAGRNGKSLLMHMLRNIFGTENCSGVTRQDISDKSPAVTQLNGKLLNMVFDGMAVYLKDSGMEKSLIAGETVHIRRLYSSVLTPVQTNGLFIEGLNREPKSSDKSTALQARIIRYWFPHVYDEDKAFWDHMTSERMVGALLSLMIDNYVRLEDKAVMLAPTTLSLELQLEHMHENSIAFQFLKYVEDTDPLGAGVIVGMDLPELTQRFNSWRLKELNDLRSIQETEVFQIFRPVLLTDRKSRRDGTRVFKVRHVVAFTKEARLFIESLKGEDAHDDTATVVED